MLFRGIRFVVAQHLLRSTVPLLETLIKAGASPSAIFVLGKVYSTQPAVLRYLQRLGCTVEVCERQSLGSYDTDLDAASQRLWGRAITGLAPGSPMIVLDHGGFLRRAMPSNALLDCSVAAIEHTSRGFFKPLQGPVPCIDMARSTLKTALEPAIICEEVLGAVERRGIDVQQHSVGVLGIGAIGGCLAGRLHAHGVSFRVYDSADAKRRWAGARWGAKSVCQSPQTLLERSSLIVGCTGRDACYAVRWRNLQGERILVSASSGDIEFATLLRSLRQPVGYGPEDLIVAQGSARLRILAGGFPINFDSVAECENASIDLTRALTLVAIVQAGDMVRRGNVIPLAASLQQLVQRCQRAVEMQGWRGKSASSRIAKGGARGRNWPLDSLG